MDDGLEDIELIRSRVRNEARQRRQQKFLRQRVDRAFPSFSRSGDKANASCGSSRSSSPDLLASPPPDDLSRKYAAPATDLLDSKLNAKLNDVVAEENGVAFNDCGIKGNQNNGELTSSKYASVQSSFKNKHKSITEPKSKIKRKFNYDSSSSEEDEEEIERRISHRMAMKNSSIDQASTTAKKRFHVQSKSDSSTDFLAKRNPRKKKSSESFQSTNDLDGNISNAADENDEPTQKMSNASPISPPRHKNDVTVEKQASIVHTADSIQSELAINKQTDMQSKPLSEEASSTCRGVRTTDPMTIDLTEDSPVKVLSNIAQKGGDVVHTITRLPTTKASSLNFTESNKFVNPDENVHSERATAGLSQSKQPSHQNSLTKASISQFESKASTNDVASMKRSSSVAHTQPKSEHTFDPIISKHITTPSNVQWTVQKQCLIVRTIKSSDHQCAPRTKVAGFDLDQTLVQWRCSGWPSRPEHYEMWSNNVITKLQKFHDDGYKLVIFSNQGGVRGAFQGKNATRIKALIDWIADMVDRPLFAVCSTKKDGGYHKGNPGMWTIMEEICNDGIQCRPELSFFVGDADGTGEYARDSKQQQYQVEGVDKLFAENVGKLRSVSMDFFTPDKFFGKSNADMRKNTIESPTSLPKEVLTTRAALLGGYLSCPVLLVMVGVQGSGKTMLSKYLADRNANWCHYSQDTISNGRPGKREAVEAAARSSLREGKNVVIDRMHLDSLQRSHFIKIGKECNVQVHAMIMIASKEEVHNRVANRVNHPGRVEGLHCARIAVSSLDRLTMPSYDEGFSLISYTHAPDDLLPTAYRNLGRSLADRNNSRNVRKTIELYNNGRSSLPMITFGTMNIGKSDTQSSVTRAVQIGVSSIDTAPTYGNEREVGLSLANVDPSIMVTIKVPKRAISASEARSEIMNSLKLLGRSFADIVLLHWPCDVIEADSLNSVWKELESMKCDGICRVIGVCNFSIKALKQLLSICDVKPAINQVERHPLLPQYDLLEYCQSQGIVVQAHTPLGHGDAYLMKNETIVQVAVESELTLAQVVLLWNLQGGVPVVTKFSSDEHSQELVPILTSNIALSPRQMKAIDEIYKTGEAEMRFVSPPFMYKTGATYAWDKRSPC